MPKPLKPLLILFSILVFAGILALAWNQWQRPAGDAVADAASSGSGQTATADPGTAGKVSNPSAQSGITKDLTASSASGDQPATAATEAGANGDKIAALTPDAGAGSGKSAVSAPGSAAQPSFDIVRVEPTGETVVAGRAVPGAKVELLSNGSVVATATADAAGEFVLILEKPLAAGGHDLALRTSGGEGVSIYSRNNVAVAVPEDPSGEVLVVMNEPGAASEILARSDAPASTGGETFIAAAQPQSAELDATGEPETPLQMAETAAVEKPAESSGGEVAGGGQGATEAAAEVASLAPAPLDVEAVEVEGSKLYAAGSARPGAIVRIYIDDELVGEARVTDKGRWLLETEAKVSAGTVTVRADQLAPGASNVVARVEVPFTRRLDLAILIPTAKGGPPTGVTAAGELPKPNAVIIRRGDNLWTISRRTYGHGIRYTTIYTANKDQIRNPHLIFPGQVFLLPVGEKSWTQ